MLPSEINQDPIQGEFFTSSSDLSERLVRESIQNSLDAQHQQEQVHVCFTFSGQENALSPSEAAPYLRGLAPHIQVDPDADASELTAIAAARDLVTGPMPWLSVEDFGTTGLTGNIRANGSNERGNHFWGFFRSIGISPKGEDDGGSWGLGKWVFPDASSINAYLGLTKRVGENESYLMGMAVLRTHHLDGNKHPPYGQFATETNESDDAWLPLPIVAPGDSEFNARAVVDFGLARSEEPGLSVIVPFPKEELSPGAIARAAIVNFFLPIVRGDLCVEIRSPSEGNFTINAETISAEALKMPALESSDAHDEESVASISGVIRLAKWAISLEASDFNQLHVPTRANDALDILDVEPLRDRYERGERLAFEFGIHVRPRSSGTQIKSAFHVFLERDDGLGSGHDYFVRGHLNIPRMNHIRRFKSRVLLTVAGKSDLAHMLRDSEGPAHVSWNPHEQRLKDHWIGGYNRVQEVRRAALFLLNRFAERPDEKQYDALADLFPAEPENIGRNPPNRRRGVQPPRRQVYQTQPQALVATRVGNSFSLSGPPDAQLVDSEWELQFAYDVVRGNAFKLFDQGVRNGVPDFAIAPGDVEVNARSASIKQIAENKLQFQITGDDFRIDISGFDHRDLILDARPIEIVSP